MRLSSLIETGLFYAKKIIKFLLSPTVIITFILIILFSPLIYLFIILSILTYAYNVILIFFLSILAISLMFFYIIKRSTHIHILIKLLLGLSILLVVVSTSFYISPEFNLWLTLSARQRVINEIVGDYRPIQKRQYNIFDSFSLGTKYDEFLMNKFTYIISDDGVYFVHFNTGRSLLNQSAFFVYKSNKNPMIDSRHESWKQLRKNWFLLTTTYAD